MGATKGSPNESEALAHSTENKYMHTIKKIDG